jgi:hypothetical protein
MIAILLSRMSDSPILIKVTVQDFWGAITIGFIAGTSGTALLQKFTISQAEKQKNLAEKVLRLARQVQRKRKSRRQRLRMEGRTPHGGGESKKNVRGGKNRIRLRWMHWRRKRK